MTTFHTILLDPPWPFRVWSAATGNGRSAESHYHTMTWADLDALGSAVDAVAADDCAMFLWACRPSQDRAIEMIAAWNAVQPVKRRRWAYKTEAFTWIKRTVHGKLATGLGYWTRANTEPVLLFTRGRVRRKAKDVQQVIETFGRLRHSEKPGIVHGRIERLVDGPYLELFARRRRAGWTCIGNELDGLDIRDSLARVAAADDLPVVTPAAQQGTLFDQEAA
jgi:N6-adenosine-specific RNA methylase IME4